jgi:hypothetical protein
VGRGFCGGFPHSPFYKSFRNAIVGAAGHRKLIHPGLQEQARAPAQCCMTKEARMRKHPLLSSCLCLVLLSILLNACGQATPVSTRTILGRWQVIENKGITVPNSFFWFTMEYVEFRADGTVTSLVHWPPTDMRELRRNKIAHYALTSTPVHTSLRQSGQHQWRLGPATK